MTGKPELVEVDEEDELLEAHARPFFDHCGNFGLGKVFQDVDGDQCVEPVVRIVGNIGERADAEIGVIVKSGVLPIDSSGGLIDVGHFDSIVEFHSSNHLGQIIESS